VAQRGAERRWRGVAQVRVAQHVLEDIARPRLVAMFAQMLNPVQAAAHPPPGSVLEQYPLLFAAARIKCDDVRVSRGFKAAAFVCDVVPLVFARIILPPHAFVRS